MYTLQATLRNQWKKEVKTMSDLSDEWMRLVGGIGTGAGRASDSEGRDVPLVSLYIPKAECDELTEQEQPSLEHFDSVALTIPAARTLLEDLRIAIDSAITGPSEES